MGRVWANGACARDFWASVGKFHESIAAVAVICVMFGPMVHARDFGRAWVNSTNLLRRLPLFGPCLGQWCMQILDFTLSVARFYDFVAAVAVICVVLWYLLFG